MLGDFACLGDLGNDVEPVAGAGRRVQTGQVDRSGRAGLFVLLSPVERVVHRLDAAVRRAADDDVADVERALLDEELGDHAASFVQLGFQAGAEGRAIGIGLVLVQFGHGQQRVEQFVDALAGDGAGLDHLGVAAPLAGQQVVGGQLLRRPARG